MSFFLRRSKIFVKLSLACVGGEGEIVVRQGSNQGPLAIRETIELLNL